MVLLEILILCCVCGGGVLLVIAATVVSRQFRLDMLGHTRSKPHLARLRNTADSLRKTGRGLRQTAGELQQTGGKLEQTAGKLQQTGGELEQTGDKLETAAENLEETYSRPDKVVCRFMSVTGATLTVMTTVLLLVALGAGYLWHDARTVDREHGIEVNRLNKQIDDLTKERDGLKRDVATLRRQIPPGAEDCINQITVKAYSRQHCKRADESVTVEIQHDGIVVGRFDEAAGETWPLHKEKTLCFPLRPPVPRAKQHSIVFHVKKNASARVPGGRKWQVSFEIEGRLGDESPLPLLTTPEVRLGGGHGSERWFVPPNRELVNIQEPVREIAVEVAERVFNGYLFDDETVAPLRDVAEALGMSLEFDRRQDVARLRMQPVAIYVPPTYIAGWLHGRQIVVPARTIVEAMDGEVFAEKLKETGVVTVRKPVVADTGKTT